MTIRKDNFHCKQNNRDGEKRGGNRKFLILLCRWMEWWENIESRRQKAELKEHIAKEKGTHKNRKKNRTSSIHERDDFSMFRLTQCFYKLPSIDEERNCVSKFLLEQASMVSLISTQPCHVILFVSSFPVIFPRKGSESFLPSLRFFQLRNGLCLSCRDN